MAFLGIHKCKVGGRARSRRKRAGCLRGSVDLSIIRRAIQNSEEDPGEASDMEVVTSHLRVIVVRELDMMKVVYATTHPPKDR